MPEFKILSTEEFEKKVHEIYMKTRHGCSEECVYDDGTYYILDHKENPNARS